MKTNARSLASTLRTLTLLIAAFGVSAPCARAAEDELLGTNVLLVTGVDHPAHPWRQTAPIIKGILEKETRLRVLILEDPDALRAVNLQALQLVVLHFQNWQQPGPGAAARENLKRFVENGGGLVSVHFACGAWHGEWPEFQNILGRVWHGDGPGKAQHDPYGKFIVEITDRNHAITEGLANFETTDELYTCLTGDAPIHLLAQAKSRVDHKAHPQAFTREYGEGRVFLTTLGHDVNAYTNNPAVGELLRRGCAWAAGLALTTNESNDTNERVRACHATPGG